MRYRGYYYDSDTDMYYLQSRYYDARIGRFINADEPEMIISGFNNSFIYCNNNPIMLIDSNGYAALNVSKVPEWIFKITTNVGWGYGTKTLIKSIIYGAAKLYLQKKKYTLARDMFYHAIYDSETVTQRTELGKDAINKIKKSNLPHNVAELLRRADRGTKILTGKYLKKYSQKNLSGNFASGDLHYAIGKYSYTIVKASVYKENFNKKSVRRCWDVNLLVTDTYNFEEVRAFENGISSDSSNNLGLFMQKTGLLRPYDIKLNFSIKVSEVQTV